MRPIDQAIHSWIRVLGPDHVILDEPNLQKAETATFATTHSIPVILRPGNREQVQQCVHIAQREGVPVYPVSSGKNWGYGSRVPSADGCALIDMVRMNHILDFSEKLGYVTLEPGVTQQQLFDYLGSKNSGLWMDPTGASPECSLIGNTMERGFGHTPYGDHFSHVCGLEVVLPTGECLETGFARFAKAKTAPLYRWGLGPNIDGIFSQSNLGIVTRMTLWLMPAPEYFQAFFFRCDSEDSLAGVVDSLRPLRLSGTIRSAVHIGNDYKVLAGLRQYPWEETEGETPLSPRHMAHFRKTLRIGTWSGSGGLYGSRGQVREARKLIRKALAGKVTQLQFMDDRLLGFAARFSNMYSWFSGWDISKALELLKPVYGLMKGIPTGKPLRSAYWRKRHAAPNHMDPDRDGCGLLWCSPALPMDGPQVENLTLLISELMLCHGFEPQISLTLITDRIVTCVVSICYDRDISGEDERAAACHRNLRRLLSEEGYPCYRMGIQSMADMDEPTGYHNLLHSLKKTLDPRNVLSPGRYHIPLVSPTLRGSPAVDCPSEQLTALHS